MSLQPIVISIFGTNQYYEPPQFLIDKFLKSKTEIKKKTFDNNNKNKNNKNNKNQPSKDTIILSFENNSFCTKINFIKNYEKQRNINNSNAYIIFIDLECVDALDKLKNIMDFLKKFGDPNSIRSYVIGKYNNNEDKIKSLDKNTMELIFNKNKFYYKYIEICTEPNERFNNLLNQIFKNINEYDNNLEEEHLSNKDKSNCLLF
jgi:hypothetical protein